MNELIDRARRGRIPATTGLLIWGATVVVVILYGYFAIYGGGNAQAEVTEVKPYALHVEQVRDTTWCAVVRYTKQVGIDCWREN